MPARGQRIGDAYVAIHAEGAGIGDDLRDDLNDLGESFDEFGAEAAERYNKAFREEQKKQRKQTNKEIVAGFDEAVARLAARTDRLTQPLERSLRKRFDEIFGKGLISDRAFKNLVKDITLGLRDLSDISLFGDLPQQIRRAQVDVEKMFADAERMNKAFNAERARQDAQIAKMVEAQEKRLTQIQEKAIEERLLVRRSAAAAAIGMARERAATDERLWKERQRRIAEERKELQGLTKRIEALATGSAEFGDTSRSLASDIRRLADNLTDHNEASEDFRRQLARNRLALAQISPVLRSVNTHWAAMADRIGALTGRGSRNNFLNFIGSVNRNLLRTAGAAGRAAEGLATLGKVFVAGLRDVNVFREAFSNLGRAISGGLSSLISIAAAIAVVVTAAGVLSSALSGLLAIVGALASSAGFALASAIGVLAGSLGVAGAAASVLVGAFLSLDEAGKKALKEAVEPLTDAFKELGDVAADQLFRDAGTQARGFAQIVESLAPVVEGIARGLRQGVNDILGDFRRLGQAEGAADLVEIFATQLPRAVRTLTNILGNLGAALAGVFAGILPATNQFLDWLEEITADFAAWATSTEGQNKIADFMDRAAESARAVGDFLGEAASAIGEFLNQTRDTGNTLFQDMADAAEELVGWLTSPEGKQAVADLEVFALDLADAFGRVVEEVVELWDELDTPENRQLLLDIVNLVEDITRGFQALSGVVSTVGAGIGKAFQYIPSLGSIIAALGQPAGERPWWAGALPMTWIPDLISGAKKIPGAIGGVVASFGGLAGRIIKGAGNLAGRFGAWVSKIPGRARRTASQAVRGFANLAGRIIDGAGNLASRFGRWVASLPGRARRAANQIIDGFGNLAGRIINSAGSLASRFGSWVASLPGRARSAADRIINGFSNLAGRIINGAGNLASEIGSWASRAVSAVASVPSRIVGLFSGLASRILSAIGTVDIGSLIKIPDPGGGIPYVPGVASGGMFGQVTNGPMLRWVGEDGPEAIVPLNRDLTMVDPSVRWLSAIAQGLTPPPSSGPTTTQEGNAPSITIVTPTQDPAAVAQEVLNRYAGLGY